MGEEIFLTGEQTMDEQKAPYQCHIFVCTNCRDKDEQSCGKEKSEEIKKILKKEVKVRGWKGLVRVSSTSCMGICDYGPNVLLHPQNIWFSRVTLDNVQDILERVVDEIS